MSIQIRISYETDAELQAIVQRLDCPGMKMQKAEQKGRFKRAYVKCSGTAIDKTEHLCYNNTEQMFVK